MVDTIYIEQAVRDHPRTLAVTGRFPAARVIEIEKYAEVFNSHANNFRIQKKNPSLILAAKQNKRVFPTPVQYETGGGANYYFSHMLNCLYDCRYCFLQGMYRSANYLLFVNYEDIVQDIKALAAEHQADDKPAWFFSGYDCDSLAFEPVTGFADYFLNVFKDLPDAVLELRTKSTQIRSLTRRPVLPNVVIAYSLSPQEVASSLETGAPGLARRLAALAKLQRKGWRIGVRFDPVIWHKEYLVHYRAMVEDVFTQLDVSTIDSVTLGGFRLPKNFYKTMQGLYPEHWLFSAGLDEHAGVVAYREEIEQQVLSELHDLVAAHVDEEILYTYPTYQTQAQP